MARKEVDITITDKESRDCGKVFHLTELDADRAEDWAIRAFMGLAVGGVTLPDSLPKTLPSLAFLSLQMLGRIPYEHLRPLLNEMMACVEVVASSGKRHKPMAGEIEEITTLVQLRKEVIELHTGFFELVANSNLLSSLLATTTKESSSPSAQT
jgi:hypothetical protein